MNKSTFLAISFVAAFFVLACGVGQRTSSSGPGPDASIAALPTPPNEQANTATPATTGNASNSKTGYRPKNGYVPDEQTAISIAVAVWIPIYGKKQIEDEKPYNATLKNGVWTVTGSLPKDWVGGGAEARISQQDGCILHVIHYK